VTHENHDHADEKVLFVVFNATLRAEKTFSVFRAISASRRDATGIRVVHSALASSRWYSLFFQCFGIAQASKERKEEIKNCDAE
jgi:hypothetical protein